MIGGRDSREGDEACSEYSTGESEEVDSKAEVVLMYAILKI
jgi:hypothetical protein